MQKKPAPILVTKQLRIADKPEVGFKSRISESLAQTRNTAGDAARAGVSVRPFKAQYVKLHIIPRAAQERSSLCGLTDGILSLYPARVRH